MNPVVRALGVTALLALMFGLLGKPILDSSANSRASARGPGAPPPAPVLPTPTPSRPPVVETPTAPPPAETAGEPLVVGQYPEACLEQVDAVEGQGLIAAWHKGNVQITSPSGGEVVALTEVRPPVQWSASGRFLVTRGPALWTSAGESLGDFVHLTTGAEVAEPERGVAWSPIADCALVMVGESAGSPDVSLVVARPSVDPTELLRGDIRELAYAPDGTELAFVAKQPGGPGGYELWALDLESGLLRRLIEFDRGIVNVVLGGWNGDDVLNWATSGASVAADGWELSAVSKSGGRTRSYTGRGTMLLGDPSGFLEQCAGRMVGVLGGDRFFDPAADGQSKTGTSLRLANLAPGQPPEFITPNEESYYSPTCSPDDRYLVAISGEGEARRLTLLDAGGAFLRTLTIDEGYADKDAIWGPSGTGVLFRRAPAGGGADVLWFIAEGAPARSLDLNVGTYDWSAERPSGLLGE